MADLQQHLGGIPAERIRVVPAPGTATEKDVELIADKEGRLFELVDGTLVEKAMGIFESLLAGFILTEINLFLRTHKLGLALPGDATLKILPGMVRIPDVSFIRWDKIPKGIARRPPIPALVPDLAVEVLSESNTRAEMAQKLLDYFSAGTRLVWYIDPENKFAEVFTSPEQVTRLDENGILDGGDVLPGFQLSMRSLFAQAGQQAPPAEGSL